MKWTDIYDIAIALEANYSNEDIFNISFVELREKIIKLYDFDDNPEGSNEKILEAIQMAWSEERS